MLERYRTIVADPPWDHSDGFASDPHSGRDLSPAVHVDSLAYPHLTTGEIVQLPVSDLAHRDCRLFLWTTNRYLPDAFGVVAAWGFSYRQLVVWHKTGNPSPFGGSVAPNHAEYLLVASRGTPGRVERWATNVIAAPAQRQHSRKPEAFLDLIEAVSPAPRLEMFSRRARMGWDTWGNESLHGGEAAVSGRPVGPVYGPGDDYDPED